MAWSERLPSGRHRGVYRDRAGRRQTLNDTYSQAAEAKREAAKAEGKARNTPTWRKASRTQTWGHWCEQWWPTRQVEGGTERGDLSRLDKHVRPYWDDEPIADIDPDAVAEWVRHLQTSRATKPTRKGSGEKVGGRQTRTAAERPLSPTTVHKCVRLFSASMRAAAKSGVIEANPCTGVELPTLEPSDETFLTKQDYDRLRAAAPDALTVMLLDLAVGTGLRWGEIVGLHRHRIDIHQRQITVLEVFDQGAGHIKPYPKSSQKRGVPITRELAAQLDEWMRAHPPVACATPHKSGKGCRGSLLLPTSKGTVQLYSNFRRMRFDPACKQAELEVTPHALRHTYASWLVQSGVSIETLSALLGHANISTTQRYAHLANTQWERVRGVLEGDVSGANEKVAPDLPHEDRHEEGGKIVHMDRWRRSTG